MGSSGQAPSVVSDFQYAGYYYHAASGLNLTLNRAYSSFLGRWLTRDPIGESGGINLYGYGLNNPILFSDPSGLDVIILYDPNALGLPGHKGLGHCAVLVSNPSKGWSLFSNNNSQIGTITQVDNLYNFYDTGEPRYSLSNSIRFTTTPEQDAAAISAGGGFR